MAAQEQPASLAPDEPIAPRTLPRSMVWLLIGCLLAMAILPWAIPSLVLRIITP
jgi:hypothetical protein